MKKFSNLYILAGIMALVMGLFSSCHDDMLPEQNSPDQAAQTPDDAFPWEPGLAFIKLKAGVTPTTRAATQTVTRAQVFDNANVKVEQIFDMTSEYASLKRAHGLDRWFVVKFDKSKDVAEVLKELNDDPAIEKAHGSVRIVPEEASYASVTRAPIQPGQLTAANDGKGYMNFSDPYLQYQWHYTTTNDVYQTFKTGADIDLFPAWQKETGDPHVVVAVMDSGIDFTHEDLTGSAWEGKDPKTGETIHGRNFWAAETGNGNPNEIIPGGHGTHVAGTIAARNNNGIGVCGVAGGNGNPNSGVRLMSCEIYGHDDKNETATTDYIVKAFEFAAENGASVMNCSWGYGFDRKKYLNNENFQSIFKHQFDLLKEGINYFTDYAGCDPQGKKKPESYMKGGLIFFASGNDAQYDIDMIPASYNRVVAVGAINSMGIPTDYMNKGPWVDVLAPGGTTDAGEVYKGVLSTVPKNFVNLSTGPYPNTDFTLPDNPDYAYAQGTSMATPHVTGIAALVVSKFGRNNPNFTNDDLRRRILGAVKPASPYAVKSDANLAGKMGVGFIDADFALSDAETVKPEAPVVTVTDYSADAEKGYYDAQINWKVTADEDALNPQHTAFSYDIRLYKKADQTQPIQSLMRYSYEMPVGTPMEQTFTGLETDVDYVVKVVACDRFNNRSQEATAGFRTRLNHAPVFTETIDEPLRLLDTQSFYHKLLPVKDEDGHSWTYTTSELPQGVELKRSGNTFDLLIKVGKPGKYAFEVTLTDQLGGQTIQKFAYEVVAHTAPTVTNVLGDVSLFEQGEPIHINLADAFTAMSGRKMSFQAVSDDEEVVKAAVNGSELTLTPGRKGTANLTVTAVDGNKRTSATVKVRVTDRNAPDAHAVYPIPAHSYIKVLMRSNVDKVHVIVTSVHGQKLIEETLPPDSRTHEITLGIDRLVPGTYYLLLKTARLTSKHTFIKK